LRFGFDLHFFEQLPEAAFADRNGVADALDPMFGADLALALIELLHRQPTRLSRKTANHRGVSGRRFAGGGSDRRHAEANGDEQRDEGLLRASTRGDRRGT
jgi:hypothetical protein